MKIAMKGLHRVSRRLADGSTRVHFYAWRGGPKIEAEPGTHDFLDEWKRLTKDRAKVTRHDGTFQQIINAYQATPAFADLADETRKGYVRRIKHIETKWGSMPIEALADPRVRGDFLDWRDEIGQQSPREADYTFAILARICSWAHDRRRIPDNPCTRPGRLYKADRRDKLWTEAHVEVLMAHASSAVALPCLLAIWTGQRQGDILGLTWSAYDGRAIRLVQSKGGRALVIPCAAPLRAALDAAKGQRKAVTICTTTRGKPWTEDGFKSSFAKVKAAAKIEGLTFHDFRGTAVTRLAIAGCSVPEIATITGHSLKTVEAILDAHYLSRDSVMGEAAIRKLESHRAGTDAVNGPVNGTEGENRDAR